MLGHLLRNGIKEASDAPLTSTRPRAFLELLWIELPHVTLVATPSAAQLLQAPASLLRCFSRFIWRGFWRERQPGRARRRPACDALLTPTAGSLLPLVGGELAP